MAAEYREFRPSYPPALFEYLATLAPSCELAWDNGTGNGQAALGLAKHFEHVIATDASAEQIAHALRHPNVEYFISPAEQFPDSDGIVDLACTAQALHWFDIEKYFEELTWVLVPNGIVAVIG